LLRGDSILKIFPAVDLMGGKVVRLLKGDPKTVKLYDNMGDPLTIAKKWEKEGADALHIIDLDAAFGAGDNLTTISKIVQAVNIPVHLGGGIRNEGDAERFINMGVDKVVLGTLAFKKPETVARLVERFGNSIVVALDYKENGKVMFDGWTKMAKSTVEDALKIFLRLGVKTFLLTSISKDGTLGGVNINILNHACAYREGQIIAAGGVGSLKDLVHLKSVGVYGVVVGKALYEEIFTLKDALKIVKGTEECR
jgi:phosphoribosylformimino-5-aminoimidazole carboxamide ribotide isomerase